MAGNGEVRIKREVEEDPLDISIPVAPKTIRKDDAGNSGVLRVKKVTQLANRAPVPIAPKPREPDYFMLNKPPPIPFNLPKAAESAPRHAPSDPMNDPPEIALKKLESEATTLKEEVAALKWLAKRKEQEWNSVVELLKKKEETWLKVKRQAELAMTDKGFLKAKTALPNSTVGATPATFASPVMPDPPAPTYMPRPKVIPSPIVVSKPSPVITSATSTSKKILVPVSQPLTPQTIQALSSQGLLKSGGLTADGKRIIVVKKTPSGQLILPKGQSGSNIIASSSALTKVVMTGPSTMMSTSSSSSSNSSGPKKNLCQECKTKQAKFECSGCSKMWYCSRECQEKNWDTHESECGLSKAVVKQEVVDDEIIAL